MEKKEWFRTAAHVCRIVLGAVFLFSGLAKGIDPWGSALKVEEYLDAFGLGGLSAVAAPLAVVQCVAESAVGLMLLCGTGLRLASLFALLFMAFFTLLTLVIAVWNPLDDCGCFGNALKLSNWMTFAKNVVLLPVAAVARCEEAPRVRLYSARGGPEHDIPPFTARTLPVCVVLPAAGEYVGLP